MEGISFVIVTFFFWICSTIKAYLVHDIRSFIDFKNFLISFRPSPLVIDIRERGIENVDGNA